MAVYEKFTTPQMTPPVRSGLYFFFLSLSFPPPGFYSPSRTAFLHGNMV